MAAVAQRVPRAHAHAADGDNGRVSLVRRGTGQPPVALWRTVGLRRHEIVSCAEGQCKNVRGVAYEIWPKINAPLEAIEIP